MDLFIPEDIKEISSVLHASGYQCYLVGGAIRNQLLGKKAKDFDLTTNATPEIVINLFKRVIPTGIKHGTVTILMGKEAYEITTYRIDGKYSDGRRPDKIEFTPSIEEDLLRRDFTINSIAYNIEEDKILDINRGIEDLNSNIIRAIGIPSKRFDEDALRLVRACRFASQLNFKIDKLTYIAMSNTLGKLADVSKERICEELLKILISNHPSIAFDHFFKCGMLEILFLNIYNSAIINITAFDEALVDLDNIKCNKPSIKFARILWTTPERTYIDTLKGLKLSNEFINATLLYLRYINLNFEIYNSEYKLRKLISEIGVQNIGDLKSLWLGMKSLNKEKLTIFIERVENELQCGNAFTIKDLDITGVDLISILTVKPGPIIGEILKELLDVVFKDPSKNRKELLLQIATDIYSKLL